MKIINLDDRLLQSIESRVEIVMETLFQNVNKYMAHHIQAFYNDIILPQAIVDHFIKDLKKESLQINAPQIGLILYLRYNEDSKNEYIKGYSYSKEIIQGRK